MFKQKFDIEKSYLNFFPDLTLKDVSLFEISHDSCVEQNSLLDNLSPYIVLLIKWQEGKKNLKQVRKLIKTVGLQRQTHFIFEPGHGKIENIIRFWYVWRTNQFIFADWHANCQWLGVMGSPWKPTLVVPLKRNILTYVMTVGFRFLDNPFKVLIKKIIGQLFGAAAWSDTIILVVMKKEKGK